MENLQVDANQQNVEVKKLNVFEKIIGVVVSPTEAMRAIAEKPKILLPAIWTALGMLLLYAARFPLYQDFLRSTTEAAIAQQNQQITPEQLEASLKFATIFGLAGAPIGSIVAWIVGGAILLALIKIFKGEGSFKQVLAITGYSYIISLLYIILSMVVSFFTNTLFLDASLANITNLFAPDLKGSYLYGIIRSIDLFTIWGFAVTGIGVAVVSKLNKNKVYTIMTILCAATILVQALSYKNM